MKVYGLIGFPLGHSFSKAYFSKKFEKEKISARYETFPIDSLEKLPLVFEENPKLAGFNVTIPYKEKIIPYLHNIEPEAKKIGAVNTVRLEKVFDEIQLTGFNTDVFGFEVSLTPLLKNHQKKAIILGSGGASRAVCYVLDKLKIEWQLVSRQPKNKKMLSYESLTPGLIESVFLIINTSPLGMFPNTEGCPDIPYSALTEKHLLYDLVYNPESTLFMQKGMASGASVKNGLEMLQLQAEKAWEIWDAR
jgi:shikimate dehydrogenase